MGATRFRCAHSRQTFPLEPSPTNQRVLLLASRNWSACKAIYRGREKEPRIDTIEMEMKLIDWVQLVIVGILAALSLISPVVRIARRRSVVLNLAFDYLALGFVGGILLVLLEVLEAIV
jgi:hypothetical protein